MARIIYVNWQYRSYDDALIHCEDRGFLFGDAVYEVCPVMAGRIVDEEHHLVRLERSMRELAMAPAMSRAALGVVLRETVRRNRVTEGWVYLEVSRGVAKRDFTFPAPGTPRTVVCLARSHSAERLEAQAQKGISVISSPDLRWDRVDIKTVQLLAPAMAKEQARAASAKEAWLVDRDGFVTEGASSNAWIVTRDGEIATRSAERGILRGVTRTVLMDFLAGEKLRISERRFTVAEAKSAAEAFVTSATNFVMPVVKVDDQDIGNGKPGPVTLRLRQLIVAAARDTVTAGT
jgi:D-alanine transaminase